MTDLNQLRREIRKQRRSVSLFQQKQAELKVLQQLIKNPHFKHSKKIGLYLHAFGEIQTIRIIQYCFAQAKQVYLPMICNMNQRLVWIKISAQQYNNQRFSRHALGMKEPMASRGVHVSHLDFLIMPLLACDVYGTRLGMGGGFYDRTLASAPLKPIRVGLAHDFQLLEQKLNHRAWDQTLDQCISPTQSYKFNRNFNKNHI